MYTQIKTLYHYFPAITISFLKVLLLYKYMHWYKTFKPAWWCFPTRSLHQAQPQPQRILTINAPRHIACIQLKLTRALHGQPLAICSQAWYHPLVTRRLIFNCFILAEIQAGPDGRIITAVALQLSQKTRKTIGYHCIAILHKQSILEHVELSLSAILLRTVQALPFFL